MFSFFYKNVGKKIRIVALALSFVCALAALAFGVLCLSAALADNVNEALRSVGIRTALISFAVAVVCPFLSFPLIGLGTLVIHAERRAESDKRIEELLQKAIGEGLLAEEIARGVGNTLQDKLTAVQVVAAAPAPTGAPIQRPVTEIEAQPRTATETVAAPAARPAARPAAPAPDQIAGGLRPLRPIGTDEQF